MTQRILFVDDDPKILKGVSRQLEGVFDLETANGPEEALELVREDGSFAVVISDMRMPSMNGVELLREIRKRSPKTVRMILTGFADLESTIEAVNEGNIFRFLSKPCSPDVLQTAIRDGLEQFRLVHAEQELLEGTLLGSVKVLSEMLSLVNPLAFGRTSLVQRIAMAIGEELKLDNLWDIKIASLLFPLGCITVSQAALECVLQGNPVPESEQAAFDQHAELARNMLKNIPRLESVAEIVAYQDMGFDGSGLPRESSLSGDDIPIGARILKVASDFEIAFKTASEPSEALVTLKRKRGQYDPRVIEGLTSALHNGLGQTESHEVNVFKLEPGMVLAKDVRGNNGHLIITKGQSITESNRQRLRAMSLNGLIGEVVEIEVLGKVKTLETLAV